MTNIFSNSSFFFMKKYNIEPIIKHDPRGICLLELSFLRKYNTHPKIAANKRIMLKENGPKILKPLFFKILTAGAIIVLSSFIYKMLSQ